MWKFLVLSGALLATGCARPSAGYSFHDLVWAASDGLREYEGWVAAESEDDRFPNLHCLAGIQFTASLAEKKTRSGDVGLPLASSAIGLTGMLGYEFISTKSETGAITASLKAAYPEDTGISEEKGKADLRQWGKDNIKRLYDKREVGQIEPGNVRAPKLSIEDTKAFETRTDLAAELWRIREALHTAVLNSPIRERGGFTLVPGPMTLEVGYTLQIAQRGKMSIQLAAQSGEGAASVGSGVTEANKMTLVYVENASKDKMRCSDKSIGANAFTTAIQGAQAAVAAPAIPSTRVK